MKILKFICTLTLFLSIQQARGQAALLVLIFGEQAATEQFHFSLDVGTNYSMLDNVDGLSQFGLHFGLGNHIKINDKSKLVIGFKPLNQRGQRNTPPIKGLPIELDTLYSDLSYRIKYNSIDVPIMYSYFLTDHWQLSAGATFSYITSTYENIQGTLKKGGFFEINRDLHDEINQVQGSGFLDLCYHIDNAAAGKPLDIRFRASKGFTPFINNQFISNTTETYFQLILSIPFLKHEK